MNSSITKPNPKRLVAQTELCANKEHDSTTNFDIFFQGLVGYAVEDGLPNRLHFYITKNNNDRLTKENGLLDLYIPIIPVCYDVNSPRSMRDFVENATSPQIIREKAETVDANVIERRIQLYAEKMMNYLKNEIANRYKVAYENNDTATMNILSHLDIMKGFDFKLYCLLKDNPSKIIEYAGAKDPNSRFILEYMPGIVEPITNKQAQSLNAYFKSIEAYEKTKKSYFSLKKTLEDYENFDINKEKHNSTIPTHSIIGNTSSTRSNKRVQKASAQSSNVPHQSQPGEE